MATNMLEHIAYVSHFVVDLLFIEDLIQMNRPRSLIKFEQFPDQNLFSNSHCQSLLSIADLLDVIFHLIYRRSWVLMRKKDRTGRRT